MQSNDDALHFGIARLAKLYYKDGLTQREIAEMLGMTPMQVSRMLKKGLDQGIITINIQPPVRLCEDIEGRLKDEFDLVDAVVVDVDDGDELDHKSLIGRAGALYLVNLMRPRTVLAVPWGSTLAMTAGHLPNVLVPELKVVQMIGGPSHPLNPGHPYEVCRRIGHALGAEVHLLDAPAIVGSIEARDTLLAESSIGRTLGLAQRADYAIFGIGSVDTGSTFYRSGMISLGELTELAQQGAVGDVIGCFIDADGEEMKWPGAGRHIGLTLEQLKAVPVTVALAGGASKVAGIRAVLRAGIANVLITDSSTAKMMLRDNA